MNTLVWVGKIEGQFDYEVFVTPDGVSTMTINITPTFDRSGFVKNGGKVYLVRDYKIGRMRRCWFLEAYKASLEGRMLLDRVEITLDDLFAEGQKLVSRLS